MKRERQRMRATGYLTEVGITEALKRANRGLTLNELTRLFDIRPQDKRRLKGIIKGMLKKGSLKREQNRFALTGLNYTAKRKAETKTTKKRRGMLSKWSDKVSKPLESVSDIIDFAYKQYNLSPRFKRAVYEELNDPIIHLDRIKRVDLRDKDHITIDGEFAKDFDDAVAIEKTKEGYILYVSIADVSSYVALNTETDKEALKRGTSIYFPARVIPMLPKQLSDDLCSLKPHKDRRTMTVEILFDRIGGIRDKRFYPSVIKSRARLTYRKVEDAIINMEPHIKGIPKDIETKLEHMGELTEIIAEKRKRRGSLDFDLPEPEITIDMEGGIKDVLRSERLFSHRIIEEFMIAANEAVASLLAERKIPAIYRVHEPPDPERLFDVERLLNSLGINIKISIKDGNHLQYILEKAKKTPYEFLINRAVLRSMKQARYSAKITGHFGLASDCYLHFTSPIRRYPDLICHRALKHLLVRTSYPYNEKQLEVMANHLSERERLAMEAEREVEDRIRILFMKERIGDVYEGIISHVAPFGLFVELKDVFVEGLILLSEIHDDYYIFQEDRFRVIGRRNKRVYRIGDMVKIRVIKADVEAKRLYFNLVE